MLSNVRRVTSTHLVLLGLATVVPLGVWGKASNASEQSMGASQAQLRAEDRVQREVRHQLRMLPYYSVFDNMEFKVNGDSVELSGQVMRPTLKSDSGRVVKRLEGVAHVVNNIEVLPLSSFDDDIRLAEYRTIYGYPGFDRYALQANPPIHIIVKNGNVRLVGFVANEMEKNLAGIRAGGVSGVFSVTNELQVDK